LKPRPDYKITEAQYRAVRVGWLERRVKAILGPDTTTITVPSEHRVCWGYPGVTHRAGYQFCFARGRLATKQRI
jgi:hypothetical protein